MPSNVIHLNVELEAREHCRKLTPKQELTIELRNDYNKFKDLFTNTGVDCYVLNTGYFMDKKVTPKMTLGLIEKIVSNEIKFKQLDKLKI